MQTKAAQVNAHAVRRKMEEYKIYAKMKMLVCYIFFLLNLIRFENKSLVKMREVDV